MTYLLNLLIAIDQLLNVLLCFGEADETMSSNAYRMERAGKPWGFLRAVIDFLFYPFQKNHCRKSYESERRRLQLPPEMR